MFGNNAEGMADSSFPSPILIIIQYLKCSKINSLFTKRIFKVTMERKRMSILGSTGSIGSNTLRVVEEFRDDLQVEALAAGRNLSLLADQAVRFRPPLLCVEHQNDVDRLWDLLKSRMDQTHKITIVWGLEGLKQTATVPGGDAVLCAIAGASALVPVLEALRIGRQLALATKEILVMAGELVMQAASLHRREIMPVDSEHNAIHQCLRGEQSASIRRIILTASGGPFLHMPLEQLVKVTPEVALRHPTWKMGKKISIDSATLMNKGLEVIEAHWLFGVPIEHIEVLIHPQSAVHSLVEMVDGSVIAQLGIADMRNAIQYALLYPHRRQNGRPALGLCRMGKLEFLAPDRKKFPCLELAYQALENGGTMPAVMNAANEIAVQAFLEGRIRFPEIAQVIDATMHQHARKNLDSLETVLEADSWARAVAKRQFETSPPKVLNL
jgi:1-deoxy-D-xylulose-5-phosphate reductoisomerase